MVNTVDAWSGQRIDITSNLGDIFKVTVNTCKTIDFVVAETRDRDPAFYMEQLEKVLWYGVGLRSVKSDAVLMETYGQYPAKYRDVFGVQVDAYVDGAYAIFKPENKIFTSKHPQDETVTLADNHSGYLGVFGFCTRENGSSRLNSATFNIKGEPNVTLPITIDTNDGAPTTNYGLLPGDNFEFSFNKDISHGECIYMNYGIQSATGINNVQLILTGINSTAGAQNIHDFQNQSGKFENLEVQQMPINGPKFIFLQPIPLISVNFGGEYAKHPSINGGCNVVNKGYLSNNRISQRHPSIMEVGISNAYLTPAQLNGLTAAPKLKVTGNFGTVDLSVFTPSDNGMVERAFTGVQQNAVLTLPSFPIFPSSYEFFNIQINNFSVNTTSGSAPTLQIEMTDLGLNNTTLPVKYFYYDCSNPTGGMAELPNGLPWGTLEIKIAEPAIWKTGENNSSATAYYNAGSNVDIPLFQACFKAKPGAVQAKEFVFRHNSNKSSSPFESLNLMTNGVNIALTSWDSTYAIFKSTENMIVHHDNTFCLNMNAGGPQIGPDERFYDLHMDLERIGATAFETTSPEIDTYVNGARDILGANHPIVGSLIEILPPGVTPPPRPPKAPAPRKIPIKKY